MRRTRALCFSEATVMCCAYSMCERRRLFFSEWLLKWDRNKAGRLKRSCLFFGVRGGGRYVALGEAEGRLDIDVSCSIKLSFSLFHLLSTPPHIFFLKHV